MAIPFLNVAIVGRSQGRSAVHAAAYASRSDLVDERTGIAYHYGRKSGDIVASWVWIPKGAPEHLRDRAKLWNEVEKAETRKNSQLARRIILGLPHELTAEQQEKLLKDFVRENFLRKGLAVDANIHQPDPEGDERNDHAHLLIPTRYLDKGGIGKKDRESNERATFQLWLDNWETLVNRQLERHGHDVRISFKTPEGQTPQIHLGQGATALERKGIRTRAGAALQEIIEENAQGAVREELAPQAVAEPETIDRDRQDADWQNSIDAAGIAYVEEQRRQFLAGQAAERETMERHGQEMAARHAAAWGEVIERHSTAPTSLQPETGAEMEQAVSGGMSFFLSLFASIAESVTNTKRRFTGRAKPDKEKKTEQQRKEEQQRERQTRELEAIHAEHARERAQFERRRANLFDDQARARSFFEQQVAEKSSLTHEFYVQSSYIEGYRQSLTDAAARKDAQQERERGGPDLTP